MSFDHRDSIDGELGLAALLRRRRAMLRTTLRMLACAAEEGQRAGGSACSDTRAASGATRCWSHDPPHAIRASCLIRDVDDARPGRAEAQSRQAPGRAATPSSRTCAATHLGSDLGLRAAGHSDCRHRRRVRLVAEDYEVYRDHSRSTSAVIN
ncbi:hypothetical protein [Nonomuraea dietziae]|uniref:hypothetical protein n=1 Tax=Nonomuraea dietziae TaxID=65515 RepID=UPI0031E12078